MVNPIGFSTGALARGDVAHGVAIARKLKVQAVELSALRHKELGDLANLVEHDGLDDFRYVSIHAPTDYAPESEAAIVDALYLIGRRRRWPVVVHPDRLHNVSLWGRLGTRLCIENLDKRKMYGRTVGELTSVLEHLPHARICFDIAHAKQFDSSMTEGYRILIHFRHRIRQVHISEVAGDSSHSLVSDAAWRSFAYLAKYIPGHVPLILETPASDREALAEIGAVARFLGPREGHRTSAIAGHAARGTST